MPLPVGSWSINTDTLGAGTLTISSVDASDNVAGSITIPTSGSVVGFFDASAQTVNLSNVTSPAQEFIVFSAALFQLTSGSPKTHTTTDSVLAGTYESYPPGGPTSTGRWVAALSQKVKEKDKEEKEKEQSKDAKDIKDRKDIKEQAKEIKDQALERPPGGIATAPAAAGDPAAQLQELSMRVDALEQTLAAGQAFIGAEERPDVGNQALGGGVGQ
jgi:hypothetical protein